MPTVVITPFSRDCKTVWREKDHRLSMTKWKHSLMAIKQYFATFLQMVQDSKPYFSPFRCSHLYPASQTLSVMFHFPENTSGTTLVKEVELRFGKCLWSLNVFMDKETGFFVNPSWKQIETRQYQNHFQKHCRKQGRSGVSNRVCRFQMQLPFQYKHWKLFFLFDTGWQSIATSMESYCDKKALLRGEAVDVMFREIPWEVDLISESLCPVSHWDMTLQTHFYDIHLLLI